MLPGPVSTALLTSRSTPPHEPPTRSTACSRPDRSWRSAGQRQAVGAVAADDDASLLQAAGQGRPPPGVGIVHGPRRRARFAR